MTTEEVLNEIKSLESDSSKKVLMKHGAREPFYGVKISDLKKIQKKIKKDHHLSLDLFNSGVSDAMYLAGLIADPEQMTREELQGWVRKAYWYMLSEYAVASVAAESKFGWELSLEWIESDKENIASAGWATLANLVSTKPDEELDIPQLKSLLSRISKEIHSERNRVKYAMNGFIIALGSYVAPLTDEALAISEKIGPVVVDMGDTACTVPSPGDYIGKIKAKGRIGRKRKKSKS